MRIRIPVVIGDKGHWAAIGWSGSNDAASQAIDMLDPASDRYRVVYVEAEVPEYEEPIVQGVVTP